MGLNHETIKGKNTVTDKSQKRRKRALLCIIGPCALSSQQPQLFPLPAVTQASDNTCCSLSRAGCVSAASSAHPHSHTACCHVSSSACPSLGEGTASGVLVSVSHGCCPHTKPRWGCSLGSGATRQDRSLKPTFPLPPCRRNVGWIITCQISCRNACAQRLLW